MQEINIKAWNVTKKKWTGTITVGSKGLLITGTAVAADDEYKVVRGLGLKDKKGQEIFERDILRTNRGKGEVIYVANRAQFMFVGEDGFMYSIGNEELIDSINVSEFEIIGNIFENGDLLGRPL